MRRSKDSGDTSRRAPPAHPACYRDQSNRSLVRVAEWLMRPLSFMAKSKVDDLRECQTLGFRLLPGKIRQDSLKPLHRGTAIVRGNVSKNLKYLWNHLGLSQKTK